MLFQDLLLSMTPLLHSKKDFSSLLIKIIEKINIERSTYQQVCRCLILRDNVIITFVSICYCLFKSYLPINAFVHYSEYGLDSLKFCFPFEGYSMLVNVERKFLLEASSKQNSINKYSFYNPIFMSEPSLFFKTCKYTLLYI